MTLKNDADLALCRETMRTLSNPEGINQYSGGGGRAAEGPHHETLMKRGFEYSHSNLKQDTQKSDITYSHTYSKDHGEHTVTVTGDKWNAKSKDGRGKTTTRKGEGVASLTSHLSSMKGFS